MDALCADLEQECADLASFLWRLTEAGWETETPFYGWTVWDEIAHLSFFDDAALLATSDPSAFADHAREVERQLAEGARISDLARRRFGALAGDALLGTWSERSGELARRLSRLPAKARLPWYGPLMSARSFATARLMETWAHGQDVFDALGCARPAPSRLKHVAHLGVTTFGWSFTVRGLPVPAQVPYVELRWAGETWKWGEPAELESIQGPAEDFCLVVTQRRNVADTTLDCRGEVARAWMACAQCFAGPPSTGPAPRSRKFSADFSSLTQAAPRRGP